MRVQLPPMCRHAFPPVKVRPGESWHRAALATGFVSIVRLLTPPLAFSVQAVPFEWKCAEPLSELKRLRRVAAS